MPTKLGIHILRAASGMLEYIRARPAVVKFVGDWATASEVPEGVLVIGRKHHPYDAAGQRNSGKTPLEAARQFVEDQLETYQSNPMIHYWEGHNEPVWGNADGMEWYARFETERIRLMAEQGRKCVIGNFASGSPPLRMWPAFLPAVQAAKQYGALLGLHEYSCPWMWWMSGRHQLDTNEDQGDEGWTTLRYRKVYRQHLIPSGLGDVRLVITECGIDPLVNPKPPGAPAGTWQQLGDYWAEHDGESDKADYYFRQLVWYDEELQKDDYVVGATPFTWGSFGPPWSLFDVSGTQVASKLIAYTEENPAGRLQRDEAGTTVTTGGESDDATSYDTNSDARSEGEAGRGVDTNAESDDTASDGTDGDEPLSSDVGPGAGEPRGLPRVQYARSYVLLPPTAGSEWARAVVTGTWDRARYSIGGSADDAGIGDLDTRRIIAINPDTWPGRLHLRDFFERYYPGVAYTAVTAATPEELAQKLNDL